MTKRADRRLYGAILGMAVIAVVLGVLASLQGPRLRSVHFDLAAATHQANQRMILDFNQPLPAISDKQITISPRTASTTLSKGSTVAVQFDQPLAYSTTYTVSVAVAGHTVRHSFKTPVATPLYVATGNGAKALFMTDFTDSGQKDRQLFTAKDITEYAVAGNAAYVNSLDMNLVTTLTRVAIPSGKTKRITLPFAGTVSLLQSSIDGRKVGFALAPRDTQKHKDSFFIYDVQRGAFTEIRALGGQHLNVLNWRFANDGRTLLVKDTEGSVYVMDGLGKNQPVPLGQFGSLSGFSADRRMAYVSDLASSQVFALDLQTTKRTNYPSNDVTSTQNLSGVYPLNATADAALLYIQQVEGDSSEDQLFFQSGTRRTFIYQADKTSIISNVTISPNDQYAALELTDVADSDATTNMQTLIIETRTGKTVAAIQGSQVLW